MSANIFNELIKGSCETVTYINAFERTFILPKRVFKLVSKFRSEICDNDGIKRSAHVTIKPGLLSPITITSAHHYLLFGIKTG